MANMHYCRFENTYNDLADCLDALEYEEELSKEEHRACGQMLYKMAKFLFVNGIVNGKSEEILKNIDEYMKTIPIEE